MSENSEEEIVIKIVTFDGVKNIENQKQSWKINDVTIDKLRYSRLGCSLHIQKNSPHREKVERSPKTPKPDKEDISVHCMVDLAWIDSTGDQVSH